MITAMWLKKNSKKIDQNGNGQCIQIIELWILRVDFLPDFKNYDENSHGM